MTIFAYKQNDVTRSFITLAYRHYIIHTCHIPIGTVIILHDINRAAYSQNVMISL